MYIYLYMILWYHIYAYENIVYIIYILNNNNNNNIKP